MEGSSVLVICQRRPLLAGANKRCNHGCTRIAADLAKRGGLPSPERNGMRRLRESNLYWFIRPGSIRSGERRRLACCSRRPAESGSAGSGGTPKPTRETRVLPGPPTSVFCNASGLAPGLFYLGIYLCASTVCCRVSCFE